jgi:hypothetical protein
MSLNREGNYIKETYNNEVERMETFVEYENKNSLS